MVATKRKARKKPPVTDHAGARVETPPAPEERCTFSPGEDQPLPATARELFDALPPYPASGPKS